MTAFDWENQLPRGTGNGRPITPMVGLITLVFAILIGLTILTALSIRSNAESKSRLNLEEAVVVAMDSINDELSQGISELRGIQGLFNASELVTREEFNIFVRGFLEDNEAIQALEWIPRVSASEMNQFIDGVRKEGLGDFIIHPATGSQDAFPVTYLEPFEGNAAALGFDLYSEDIRRAALLNAWESGELAITEPITLVQEGGSQLAFLAYAPVYSSKDIPGTLQERRDLLVGFGLGVIKFGDFIDSVLPPSFDPNVGIIVVDAKDHPEHESVFYTNQKPDGPTVDVQGLEVIRSVTVADKEWIFHFSGPPGFGVSGFERTAWILVLGLGLFFSAIILGIVLLLYRGRQAALSLSVERQQSEEVQRALAQELAQLIDTANNPIFGVDTDGRINIWNGVMQDITGASSEEAIGRRAIDFMSDESKAVAVSHLQSVLSGTPCGDLSLKFSGPAGDSSDLLVNCTLRRDVAGSVTGILGVCLDITERLRAEQEIRTLNESLEVRVADRTKELQEAAEEMESFSYSVSHDLRSPLRSINGFSLAVLEKYGDKLDDEGRSYLNRVRSATQRMGTLIDELLTLSRVGQAEITPEPLDLAKMAQEQAGELRDRDPEREVEFVIAKDITAFGDERLIEAVMENLVHNAWKFSSKHATTRIEIGKQEQNGEAIYFVKDDGAGFDMAYADKLFLPFQRLHPTGEFEGTGIGLATVRRIIQRHGGRIWAEGEVEKGATVYFTLGHRRGQNHE